MHCLLANGARQPAFGVVSGGDFDRTTLSPIVYANLKLAFLLTILAFFSCSVICIFLLNSDRGFNLLLVNIFVDFGK